MRRGSDVRSRCGAFTLIEMMAVIALLALLAGGATLSLASMRRSSDMKGVIERLTWFDALTRQEARRGGKAMVLRIDTGDSTIGRGGVGGDGENGATLHLPDGFVIDRVTTAERAGVAGRVEIAVSSAGLSPTYAVLLVSSSKRQWVVVSDIGQVSRVDDESTIDQLFQRLASR